ALRAWVAPAPLPRRTDERCGRRDERQAVVHGEPGLFLGTRAADVRPGRHGGRRHDHVARALGWCVRPRQRTLSHVRGALPMTRRLARALAPVTVGLIASLSTAQAADVVGTVRFFKVAKSSFDAYTKAPTPEQQAWMRSHYWRMLVYAPYFDSRLGWFPNAWVYKDLYAIYVGSDLATSHPEWILHDQGGKSLFIPYACSGGTCPQFAADIGDPTFRGHWIAEASAIMTKGYRGLFVDDVNMTISRISDGSGHAVPAVDRRTGRTLGDTEWRGYMATFTEEIRAAFPTAEIVHNNLWFV